MTTAFSWNCLAIVAVSLFCAASCSSPSGTDGSNAHPTMSILAGNDQLGLTDDALAIRPAVKVADSHGQPVPGVVVTFTPGFRSGKISVDTATTDSDGIATGGTWTLGFVGANALSATAVGVDNAPLSFDATARDLLGISIAAGFNQMATAGTAVPIPLAVQLMGVFTAAPIVGATVTFTVTDGGGSITGATTTTNAQGIATVGSWTLGPVPGPNHLTATVSWPGAWSLTMGATGTP